jgi:hypothetical protein
MLDAIHGDKQVGEFIGAEVGKLSFFAKIKSRREERIAHVWLWRAKESHGKESK